jgi:hypothetical protein
MKSIITISALAIVALTTSCSREKDWLCVCNTTAGTPSTYNIDGVKKKLAEERCKEREVGIATDCTLK